MNKVVSLELLCGYEGKPTRIHTVIFISHSPLFMLFISLAIILELHSHGF